MRILEVLMTFKNIDSTKQIVSNLNSLDIDAHLAVLGESYPQITDIIPGNAIDTLPTEKAADLVARIQQISSEK